MRVRFETIGFAALMAISAPSFGQGQPAAQPTAQAPPCITIDDAIVLSVTNSPALAIARERVNRAQNQLREAAAQQNFRIDARASYSGVTPTSSITIPGPGGEPVSIQTRPASSSATNVTLAQPLDAFRRLALGRQIAGYQLDVQAFGEMQFLQTLIADVKTAYYNVLRANANVEVSQSFVALAQERLRIAQAQLEAGTAARFDVTRAAVDVANRKQTLIQAQNQVQVAQAALNRVMGIDINQPVAVQDQEVPVAVETVDIPAEMAKALQARPDILQANSSILSAKKNVAFVSKENKPALAAFLSTDYTNASTVFSGSALTHTYGINMAWPIWTGGVTTARIAQAKNDVNIAADALGVTKLSIEQEVRTAALNLIEASKRVATSQENVSLAEESLRLSMIRYEEGVAIQVEVSDAENALVQARINYVSARYDYLTALAQLQRATASQPEYGRLTSAAPAAVVSQGVKK